MICRVPQERQEARGIWWRIGFHARYGGLDIGYLRNLPSSNNILIGQTQLKFHNLGFAFFILRPVGV